MAAQVTRRRTPPVNATLTGIGRVESVTTSGGGHIDELVSRWTGSSAAYVTEKVELFALSSQVLERPATQVVFPSDLIAGIADDPDFGEFGDLEIGDVLTYSRAGAEHKREITAFEDRSDYGFLRCFTQEFVPP